MTDEPNDEAEDGPGDTMIAAAPAVEESTEAPPAPVSVQRTCRKCSATVETSSAECPVCHAPYVRPGWTRRRTIIAVAGALALGATVLGLILYASHREDVRAEKAQAAADAREEAREAAAEERREEEEAEEEAAFEAAAEAEADLQAQRAEGLQFVRKTIAEDARKKVQDGTLTGPILGVSCDPAAGGVDDTTATTESYSCIAITRREGTRSFGYPVNASFNYETSEATWQYDV